MSEREKVGCYNDIFNLQLHSMLHVVTLDITITQWLDGWNRANIFKCITTGNNDTKILAHPLKTSPKDPLPIRSSF